MINEILKLINEDGKLFSLTQEKVTVDVLNGKQIAGIYNTECSNLVVLITKNGSLYEVYTIASRLDFQDMEIRKHCISFEELDFNNI